MPPVNSKDIDKVSKLVTQRDLVKEQKKAFNDASRIVIMAMTNGRIDTQINFKNKEDADATAILNKIKDKLDSTISGVEVQISGMGVTP